MEQNVQAINEGKYLLTDLIQGDEAVAEREDFQDLDGEDIREAIKIIFNNPQLSDKEKQYILANVWRIHYRVRPPSIEEFLTPDWLGPTALSVYSHVRKNLEDFWHPMSPYRHMILASSIGYGKSFAATVSSLYIATHLWALRNAKKFFGLADSSSIVQSLISFAIDKAKQLLLQPYYQILISSPKFRRVRMEEKLIERQEEYPDEIVWTSAGKIGQIQFYNDVHVVIASHPAHLLGLSLISATLTELSFFLDRGISPDTIWRTYNDAKGRVYSRFSNRYFATTIMDSSPNDMGLSPIDKYIFSGTASKDPLNYIVTGEQWKFFPEKYPIWQKDRTQTFPVFRGNASKPPRIIETEEEMKQYTSTEIYQVPIDIKQHFIDDLKKSVKDYCGWPSGSQSRLFADLSVIDSMFTPQLKNVYSYIKAPATQNPERLIWSQVVYQFFMEVSKNRFQFYRAAKEKRYLHIDQSESQDSASIGMVHPETDKDGNTVIVVDFTLVIVPDQDRINLDAISDFILDIRKLGRIEIDWVTFDQYQSSSTIQRFKREGLNCERLSVDKDRNPYMLLSSWTSNGRVKAGRNIFLKNNLKSLQEITTDKGTKKIDHQIGTTVNDDGGDWETSEMGVNAKDCSDGLCGAVWNCVQHFEGVPRYQYEEKFDQEERTHVVIKERVLKNVAQNLGMRAS